MRRNQTGASLPRAVCDRGTEQTLPAIWTAAVTGTKQTGPAKSRENFVVTKQPEAGGRTTAGPSASAITPDAILDVGLTPH